MSYLTLGGTTDDATDFMTPSAGKGMSSLGNSNLSALFGLNNQINNNPNSNQALTYTAPKPPGKSDAKPQQSSGASGGQGIAYAVAVTAYRFVNGQNANQGKLGAAVLKNVAEKDYKILMYRSKQQPVSTSQISPAFQFIVQPNNYVTFNDDQKQTWTILFTTGAELQNFAKQVCLAKLFTSPQPAESSIQDLLPVDQQNQPVESGDSLEMKYTGWLVTGDGSLGTVFDSNHNSDKTFRFKCGRGKVIKGWDAGVLGMRKGGKRFLVIPPQLAYGQKAVGNRVPPNSTLAFEVDLLRVKRSKENSSAMQSGESVESLPQAVAGSDPPPSNPAVLQSTETPAIPPTNNFPQTHESESVKGRTASLNEQLSGVSGDGSKNALLSRMARMGHAMVPVAATAEVSTPEYQPPTAAVPVGLPEHQQPAISPNVSQPLSRSSTPGYNGPPHQPQPHQLSHAPAAPLSYPVQSHPHHQPIQQVPTYPYHSPQHQPAQMQGGMQPTSQNTSASQNYLEQPVMPSSEQQQSHYNSYSNYQQLPQYTPSQTYGSDLMPILVSETRQQSAEMRLLQEKVDKVSGLVEQVKKFSEEANIKPKLSTSQNMDAEAIMRNVQRIMLENDQLKASMTEKNKQIEQQNEKIGDLLQQNQKYVEKSNLMLEQRNDTFKESFTQSQVRSLQLEQDKVDLTQRLSDATSKVSELTLEVTDFKQRESDLRQKFKELFMKERERANDAEEKLEELTSELKEKDDRIESISVVDADTKVLVDSLREETVALKEKYKSDYQIYRENLDKLSGEKEDLENRLKQAKSEIEVQAEKQRSDLLMSSTQIKEQMDEVNSLQDRFSVLEEELKEALEAKEIADSRVSLFKQKFGQMRTAFENQQAQLQDAETEAEEAAAYKTAYERLRSQASVMKEKYEAKIVELKEAIEAEQRSKQGTSGATSTDEVKKMMNAIFQRSRSELDIDEEYSGGHVLNILLGIIKDTTLSLLEKEEETVETAVAGSEEKQTEVPDEKVNLTDDQVLEAHELAGKVPPEMETAEKPEVETAAAKIPEVEVAKKPKVYDYEVSEYVEDIKDASTASREALIPENAFEQGDVDDERASQKLDHDDTDSLQSGSIVNEKAGEDLAHFEINMDSLDEKDEEDAVDVEASDLEPNATEDENADSNNEDAPTEDDTDQAAPDEESGSDVDEPVRKSRASSSKPTEAPIREESPSGSSLTSVSDDRKPPPLFEDDSADDDEDDLDWLK